MIPFLLALVAPQAAARPIDLFLAELRRACEQNDRQAVAGMIHYPLKVIASGWIIPVDNRATLVKYYDAFFTDDVKDAIGDASADPRLVKATPVVVVGRGTLRIMRIGNAFKIIGITVPVSSGRVRAARRGVSRVRFDGGRNAAAYSGSLAVGERESYVVALRRNDLLDVRIDGVRGLAIVAHVTDAQTKAPVDDRAAAGARVWIGRVPMAGDYGVEIVRNDRAGDVVLTYILTITVR